MNEVFLLQKKKTFRPFLKSMQRKDIQTLSIPHPSFLILLHRIHISLMTLSYCLTVELVTSDAIYFLVRLLCVCMLEPQSIASVQLYGLTLFLIDPSKTIKPDMVLFLA